MRYTIRFENRDQVVLWECELKGQISDGFWEDEDTDRRLWNSIGVVNPANLGMDFENKHPINLADVALLDQIAKRLIGWVKIVRRYPHLYGRLKDCHTWFAYPQEFFHEPLAEALLKINVESYSQSDLERDLEVMTNIIS